MDETLTTRDLAAHAEFQADGAQRRAKELHDRLERMSRRLWELEKSGAKRDALLAQLTTAARTPAVRAVQRSPANSARVGTSKRSA